MVPLLHLSKVGRTVGGGGGMLTVNIQDKGGEEFFKSKERKAILPFQGKQREWVGLASCQASLLSAVFWRQLSPAHHCPTSHSTDGTAPSVVWSNPLDMFTDCFFAVFLNLPPPSPRLTGTLISPLLTKECIQGSTENALLYSPQFPTDKTKLKQICTQGFKGERAQCDECVGEGAAAVVAWRWWWKQRQHTKLTWRSVRLAAALPGWVGFGPGSMGFLPMLHSKEWGPSQWVSAFHIWMIKMFSLPTMHLDKVTNKKTVELEQFGGREEDKAVFVGRTKTWAISISPPDNSPALGTVRRCFPRCWRVGK